MIRFVPYVPCVPCAVHSCLNQTAPRHRFPHPKKELNRFKEWISRCSDSVLSSRPPMKVYPQARICDVHFERKYIGEDGTLTGDAIPSLHLSRSKLAKDPLSISQECENNTFNFTSEENIKTEEIGLQATTESEINIQSTAEEPAISTRSLLGSECELIEKEETKLETLSDCDVPKAKNVHEKQETLLNQKVSSYVIDDSENVSTPYFDEELHSTENTRNDLLEKFDKMCRICFSQNKLEPFFSLQFQGSSLHEIYTKLTSIVTNVADKLPDYICKDCIETLTKTFKFLQRCQESYKLLQEIVSNHDFNLVEKNNDVVLEEANRNHSETNFDNLIKSDDTETSNAIVPTIDNIITSEDLPNEILEDNGSIPDNPPQMDFVDMDAISKEQLEISSLNSTKLPPFSCKGCLRRFHDAVQLQEHTFQNKQCRMRKRIKIYQCSVCKTQFSTADNLEGHTIRVHPKVKLYQCDICSQEYRYRGSLRRHQKIHEQKARQRLLQEKVVHESEDLHPCTVCNEVFTSLQDLQQHTKLHVSGVDVDILSKPLYKCPKSEIMENGKRWPCSQCPKTFKSKSKLYYHEQDHIEGKRNHNTSLCTVCGKFFNKSQLAAHIMKSHTDPSKKSSV